MSSKFFTNKQDNKNNNKNHTPKNSQRSGAKKTIVQKAGRGK